MKRLFVLVLCLLMICSVFLLNPLKSTNANVNEKLLRFHVVANSDSESDQAVKLKVRDAILEKMGPVLSVSKDRNESIDIMKGRIWEIEKIANEILAREGKKYRAKAEVGEFAFPIKSYGDITLPAGQYTALKVVLGNGDGKNWWCVMFPPLCFVDITKGLTSDITDEELKKILNEEEIESITAFKQESPKMEVVGYGKSTSPNNSAAIHTTATTNKSKNPMEPSVEFKFKSVELIKSILGKISRFIKNRG